MQRRFKAASLVLLAGLSLSLIGCGKMNELKARKAFKDANVLYVQQDYKRAADKYQETIELDPKYAPAYFYLANSYDNQFKVTKRGDATNDGFLTKAVDYYRMAADNDPDPKQRKLALLFLVAAYGSDKLNDPGQAVPLLEKMIQMEPNDVENYFRLAKMYEDAGQYDAAEQEYLKAKDVGPKNSDVYAQLAGFYNRQGEFDKTIDAYKQQQQMDPQNPVVYYTIGSFYWDKAYRDKNLKEADKKQMAEAGLQEVNKALEIKSDYIDALIYKGLLLRLQASWEKDRAKYDELMNRAKELNDKAAELQKRKAAGLAR
jgi:tetratricopeptide (TPR) repeat protein